jgi:hypothetical protein
MIHNEAEDNAPAQPMQGTKFKPNGCPAFFFWVNFLFCNQIFKFFIFIF